MSSDEGKGIGRKRKTLSVADNDVSANDIRIKDQRPSTSSGIKRDHEREYKDEKQAKCVVIDFDDEVETEVIGIWSPRVLLLDKAEKRRNEINPSEKVTLASSPSPDYSRMHEELMKNFNMLLTLRKMMNQVLSQLSTDMKEASDSDIQGGDNSQCSL